MEENPNYEEPIERIRRRIIYATIASGVILFLFGAFVLPKIPNIGVLLLVLSVIVGVVPYSALEYMQYKKFRSMENRFPSFIRGLAENKKSGATFPQALELASKANYGPLSEEIRKTATQVSWGMPFQKALAKMGERLKESSVIKQSLLVINESFLSGGDIAGIMDSVSMNMNSIKDAYEERRSVLSQQGLIMYFIFFVFLGIAIVLYNVLIPLITSTGGAGEQEIGGGILGVGSIDIAEYCNVIPPICSLGLGLGFEEEGIYFQTLFFIMAVIQAISIGIISGFISQGRATAGLKHVAIMLTATLITFTILL